MTRSVYFDCFSGASGDMLLGALVDAGAPLDEIARELQTLPLSGYELTARPVLRAGIAATKVDVVVAQREQPHRHLATIAGMIDESALAAADKAAATAVFHALAEVEAKVHATPMDAVEFHEVGAVDSIVDVVGTVVALRLLGVSRCFVSPLPVGGGEARSAHGTIPVPGPATLELLARAKAPIAAARPDDRFELVTPTGAAILTTLGRFERPSMTVERVGTGAGGRDTAGRPNVLRAWLGETATPQPGGLVERRLLLVESNIDDSSPEVLGWAQERLFAAGALDVWCTSIQMKKSRPGVMLQALCPPEAEDAVVGVFLRETSTLGVRVREVRRLEAARESLRFRSSLGEVRIKVKRLAGEAPRIAPEYEDCRALAIAHDLPLVEVYRLVAAEAEPQLREG